MIVAGSASPLLLSSAGGYNLTNSLRFRASASAWLNRTPASSGNLNLWTLSWWTKRGQLSTAAQTTMFGTDYASSQEFMLQFTANNRLVFEQYASGGATNLGNLISTQVFRDPSAWYHIVVTWDSAQATASNRIKIYVNGSQITAWDTASYPAQNASSVWNQSTNQHRIGQYSTAKFYDGYMGEVNFIDGQALTPSSFGQTSATTGVWIPKKYTGTYGTNGFYLPFTDNSALTTSSNAGLGKDFSGNSNYWTTNNISITSGSTYDSMTDVPTLTSATTANYCVLNPVDNTGVTITNGNLTATTPSSNQACKATMSLPTTGKFYFEVTDVVTGGGNIAGIANVTLPTNTSLYLGTGSIYVGMSSNAVFGLAFNFDALTYTIYKNNSVDSTGSITSGITYIPFMQTSASGGASTAFNFGQRPFAYTPPTGFNRLNTFNLPTPTIGATASTTANKYFDATLYTGAGNTSTSITNAGGFQPDLVWTKARSIGYNHYLFDSVRGTGSTKSLYSDNTEAEGTYSSNGNISSFNSNGWTIGTTSGTNALNASGQTFVGWQWRASGSTVSNTAGTITSTVSANTTAGFSIVTYTGNGTNGSTVGHGLGVAPSMIIVKSRSTTGNWITYHTSTGINQYLYLNSTNASSTTSPTWGVSSTTFTLQQAFSDYNTNGTTYVAYVFSQVAGYSAFGSYTGNGSSDGTFVYTGFRPRFIMFKVTTTTNVWIIHDTARDTYNVSGRTLIPNASDSEYSSNQNMDILSNGFKLRSSDSATNQSGQTFIYMAFAENPFKYANAR